MKTKISIILFLLITGVSQVNAQWIRVGKFNNPVNDMIVYFNHLYIAGDFTKYDGTNCYSACHWDGTTMFKITDPLPGIGVRRLNIFENQIFGTNALNFNNLSGFATYNMNNWNPEPGFTKSQTGLYSNLNYIFIGSDLGVLKKRVRQSAIYNILNDSINGGINAISEYNGNLVVAGNFTIVTAKSRSHIALMNMNGGFDSLGTGLDGNVTRLINYNGKLYACGTFLNAGGVPAKYLARWNGTTWSQVGGGLTSTGINGVKDMMVYNNSLYIAGEFTKAGNIDAINLVKWNDTTWTPMNYNMPGYVSAIKVYANTFFISSFSGDSAILYKFPGANGINELIKKSISATIYPNPAQNEIHISLDNYISSKMTYELLSMEGKIILSDEFNSETTISINGIQAGIYMIRIKGEQTADIVRKIIVE
ncbi:MAG: T9SS type A sorting domain-containing protein [Bacteroidia bacterium]|nr:T9SS type A sorting domain-containing protein [Bacteroidia bacterium]